MRVLICGAGVGGLTAALALPRGARAVLLEQAPMLRGAGAGIQISPNATRRLQELGLESDLAEIGFEPQAAVVRDALSGRDLLRQPLGEHARRRWGAPYLHVHRADLQAVLLRAVETRGEATLRLDARVAGLEQDGDGVRFRLADGEAVEGEVAVGSDGVRSAIRWALIGANSPRYTGYVAWRGVVEAARLPGGLIEPIASVWAGEGRHFVHYYVRGGTAVNFVGMVKRPDWESESWSEQGDPADLARDFAGWPAPVQAIIAAVDEAWRWALFDRPPLPRWSVGRATLLGDAAHPMLPSFAQGAAMAIEDAAALGRQLALRDIPAALAAYEAERRARTARVQALSRRNARLFHLPRPLAAAVFAAAGVLDRLTPAQAEKRFDWLYGG